MSEHLIEVLNRLATGVFTAILILIYLYARAHIYKAPDIDELDEPPEAKKIASGESVRK
jgi:hypothetical protein